MLWLKQSTAATIKLGPFLDDTDQKTIEDGLTISQADIRLSKNGGDFAQTNNATGATHDEQGWYDIPLDTTDTNTLGRLKVAVNESGALPCWESFMVLPANVYNSLIGGSDNLQTDMVQIGGTVVAAASVVDTNIISVGGTAVSLSTEFDANITKVLGVPAATVTEVDSNITKVADVAVNSIEDFKPEISIGTVI